MISSSCTPRPAGSPAYYLGRPASLWIAAAHHGRPAATPAPRRAGALPAAGVPVVDPGEAHRQATGAGLVVHRADPLNAETPPGCPHRGSSGPG